MTVAESFLRGRVRILVDLSELKESIGGGDNVFYLGAGSRLQQWERVDENCRIWNQLGRLLELC